MTNTVQLLPPPLIHELRAKSFHRLYRMAGNPGNRGFGRVLRRRIHAMVGRERSLVEKAITIAYMGSYLVDHIIYAEKAACRILEQRELTETEEHRLWEKNYADVIVQLAYELPEGIHILDTVVKLEHYGALPAVAFGVRLRHWRSIHRLLQKGWPDPGGDKPELALMRRVQLVLSSERSVRAKARHVVLAASLMADRECWAQHVAWPDAYLSVMTDLYPALAQHPQVLEELVLRM